MKLFEIITEQQLLYHIGADVPTSSLRKLTFFTDDTSARTFADTASYVKPKMHVVVNNISNPATDQDVVGAARQLGCYDPHTQPMDYVTYAYYGNRALQIGELLKKSGFDGIVLNDVAADGKTRIKSYIPFTIVAAK